MPVVNYNDLDFSAQVKVSDTCTYAPLSGVRKKSPDDKKDTKNSNAASNTYFYKDLQESKLSTDKITYRLIAEAIAGYIAQLISSDKMVTPNYELVLKNNELVGLLTSTLPNYDQAIPLTEYGDSKQFLNNPGSGESTALRFFLKDPDGENNTRFFKSKTISLDYGLSFCDFLNENDSLLDAETEERVPPNANAFEISETGITAGLLQPVGKDFVRFLCHHPYPKFTKDLAANANKNNYLEEIYGSFKVISDKITVNEFANKIKEKLGYSALPSAAQAIFDMIIKDNIARAYQLQKTLSNLPLEQFLQKIEQLISVKPVDSKVSQPSPKPETPIALNSLSPLLSKTPESVTSAPVRRLSTTLSLSDASSSTSLSDSPTFNYSPSPSSSLSSLAELNDEQRSLFSPVALGSAPATPSHFTTSLFSPKPTPISAPDDLKKLLSTAAPQNKLQPNDGQKSNAEKTENSKTTTEVMITKPKAYLPPHRRKEDTKAAAIEPKVPKLKAYLPPHKREDAKASLSPEPTAPKPQAYVPPHKRVPRPAMPGAASPQTISSAAPSATSAPKFTVR